MASTSLREAPTQEVAPTFLLGITIRMRGRWARPIELFLLAFVLLRAFILRWGGLATALRAQQPIAPDAQQFLTLANSMRFPWANQNREPVWVWTIKAWSLLGGGKAPEDIRALTLLISMSLVLVSYLVVRRLSGWATLGIVTAYLVATNRFLVQEWPDGLRTVACMTLGTVLVWLALDSDIGPRRRLVGLTLCSAALVGLYFETILLVTAVGAFAFAKQHLGWKNLIYPVIAIGVVIGPFLAYNQVEYGSPLHFVNINTGVWYRNYEFLDVRGTGCDGCPATADDFHDQELGSYTTTWNYVFGMHSLHEVGERIADGYWDTFTPFEPRGVGRPTSTLWLSLGRYGMLWSTIYLIGICVLLATPWRILLLVPLISLNLTSFIASLQGFDPRIAIEEVGIIPMLAMAVPIALAIARSGRGFETLLTWDASRHGRHDEVPRDWNEDLGLGNTLANTDT